MGISGIRFAPLEKHRLSDLIVDRITDLISAGEYQVGMRLPSERELARSCEVSRPLIREALRIVESLGLIAVRPGIGAIVTRNGPETANVAGYVSVQGQGDGLLNSVRVSCFCPLSCGKSDTKPLAVGIVSWH